MSRETDAFVDGSTKESFGGILIAEEGVIKDVSDSLLASSGYVRDEVVGRRVSDFVTDGFRDMIQQRQASQIDGHFGAQIGVSSTDVFVLFMNDDSVDSLMKDRFGPDR